MNEINYSIISINLKGYILSWNKSSTDLYGYEKKDIIGKHISFLYKTNEHIKLTKLIDNTLSGCCFEDSFELINKSKIVKYISLRFSILPNYRGKPYIRI